MTRFQKEEGIKFTDDGLYRIIKRVSHGDADFTNVKGYYFDHVSDVDDPDNVMGIECDGCRLDRSKVYPDNTELEYVSFGIMNKELMDDDPQMRPIVAELRKVGILTDYAWKNYRDRNFTVQSVLKQNNILWGILVNVDDRIRSGEMEDVDFWEKVKYACMAQIMENYTTYRPLMRDNEVKLCHCVTELNADGMSRHNIPHEFKVYKKLADKIVKLRKALNDKMWFWVTPIEEQKAVRERAKAVANKYKRDEVSLETDLATKILLMAVDFELEHEELLKVYGTEGPDDMVILEEFLVYILRKLHDEEGYPLLTDHDMNWIKNAWHEIVVERNNDYECDDTLAVENTYNNFLLYACSVAMKAYKEYLKKSYRYIPQNENRYLTMTDTESRFADFLVKALGMKWSTSTTLTKYSVYNEKYLILGLDTANEELKCLKIQNYVNHLKKTYRAGGNVKW